MLAGRAPRAWTRALYLLLICLIHTGLSGCCLFIPPPDAQELLSVGFRTPEQTFHTFQIGWRADEPDLERRCLSSGFLERNRVGKLAYREFRERLAADQPLLRKGIADARIREPAERHGDRARLTTRSHGRILRFDLVLDDYCEVWAGDQPVIDDYLGFGEHTGIQEGAGGSRWVFGRVEVPAGQELESLTELRFGREWKIDGFELLDEASDPHDLRPSTHESPPAPSADERERS